MVTGIMTVRRSRTWKTRETKAWDNNFHGDNEKEEERKKKRMIVRRNRR